MRYLVWIWMLLLVAGAAPAADPGDSLVGPDSLAPRRASLTPLPFAFYSQFFHWTAGVYLRSQDLVQAGAQADVVLFGSSNGTRYLYHQMRDFHLPGLPRLFLEPTVYAGRFGEIRAYTDNPAAPAFPGRFGERAPGRRLSDPDHYLSLAGRDLWVRAKLRWLAPLGHGARTPLPRPVLERGRLVGGARGGASLRHSGLTFLEVEPFHRRQLDTTVRGASFGLTRENWDFEDNPARGGFQSFSWQRDPGQAGVRAPWSIVQGDLRGVWPLDRRRTGRTVLALNAWSGVCPTWNDSHLELGPGGERRDVLHRPPAFAAPALGSDTRFRAYYQNRFTDKAFLYYGAELRQLLPGNPLAGLRVHWLQAAAFAEVGRVAPAWSPGRLHEHMHESVGVGLRLMFTDLVLRLDVARGREGSLVQMFMGQAF